MHPLGLAQWVGVGLEMGNHKGKKPSKFSMNWPLPKVPIHSGDVPIFSKVC